MVLRTFESQDNPPEVCKLYTAGKCRSGTRCKLLHEPVPEQATDTQVNECTNDQEARGVEDPVVCTSIPSQADGVAPESGGPGIIVVQKVGETCRQWQKGRCQWGERCHFQHEIKPDQLKVSSHDVGNTQPPNDIQSLDSTSAPSPVDSKSKQKGKSKITLSTTSSSSNPSSREIALRRIKEQADAARLARIEQEGVVSKRQEQLSTRLAREQELEAARKKRLEETRRLEEARKREKAAERQRQEEEWAKEDAMTIQQIILNSIVKLEAGLTIHHVICGFEASQILVKNLPVKTTKSEIIEFLTKPGSGISEQDLAILRTETVRGRQQATVVGKAVDLEDLPFSELEFRGANLEFTVCGRSSEGRTMGFLKRDSHHLTISWRIPYLTMVARYPRSNTWNIQQKARDLNGQLLNGQCVQTKYEEQHVCSICSPDPEDESNSQPGLRRSIKISWIPANTTIVDVKTFAGTPDVKPHYTSCTTKEIFDALDARLRALPNSTLTTFTLEKSSDPASASAKAVFSSWEGAKSAYDSLDGKVVRSFFPSFKLSLSDPYNFILTLDESEHHAQRNQLAELQSGLDKTTTIKMRTVDRDSRRRIAVTLSGRDRKVVGALKVRIENMAAGQKLDASYWHPMLKSGKGRKFFDSLHEFTGAFARFDWKHNCITLSGDSEAVEAAKTRLREEIKRLSAEECAISLPRRTLGFFVREGLEKMRALLGEENVTLDVEAAKVVLHGADLEEAKHHLKQLVNAFAARKPSSTATPSDTPCPICYDTVSQPIEISCKHIYCSPCLRHYILSTLDNHNFPLKCMGNDATCNKPLSIPLIQRFLPPQRFEQLMIAAFVTHISRNSQTFRYCTTPGCSQVYRTTPAQREIQCPSCFSEICAACHDEGHAEMTCAAKRAQKHPGEQERLLEAWANKNDVKKCPSCHAWLDKTEGSNHMSCKCGVSFCWVCRGAFGAGQISAHMSEAHGGLYGIPTPKHNGRECLAARPRAHVPQPDPFPVLRGHAPSTVKLAVPAHPIATAVPSRPAAPPTPATTHGQATRAMATHPLQPQPQAPSATTPVTRLHHITQATLARPITLTVPQGQSSPAIIRQNALQTSPAHEVAIHEREQRERERRAAETEALRQRERREAEVREAFLRESRLREAKYREARLNLERDEYEAARRKVEEEKGWCLIM